ncbi:MAG TPA: SRPBCC domain-containing protein [Chryseosolibacter sp.]
MQNEKMDPAGREQRTSVVLEASLAKVWEVWTKPEHISQWWGPNGFTSTIEKMDVRPGGEWLFVMHGPDGSNYPNKTLFREVVKHKRIMHEHVEPNFIAIIDFESQGENRTLLTWYKLYETRELFQLVEIQYKSSEGLRQTMERLQRYVITQ